MAPSRQRPAQSPARPTVGVTLSALWLGEPVGWDVVLGGALIVASVVLAARGG